MLSTPTASLFLCFEHGRDHEADDGRFMIDAELEMAIRSVVDRCRPVA